jgi:hypothetical protein
MGITNNGSPLVGATYWIWSTFKEGSSDQPEGYTGMFGHGSMTDPDTGITVYTGELYSKPGFDSTLLASGAQQAARGFTVTQNSSDPMFDFVNNPQCQ